MSSLIRRAGSKLARLIARGADPGVVAAAAQIYAKDVAGTTQLFAEAGDGTVSQLTPAARGIAVVVDFGATVATGAITTGVGQGWITTTSRLFAQASGATADHTAEDALIEQIEAVVENVVPGTGFDLRAHSPLGSTGQYAFLVIGVEA